MQGSSNKGAELDKLKAVVEALDVIDNIYEAPILRLVEDP
jgi:hypothetical protein